MDNSLLDIGTVCSLSSCSNHDFLPIFCPTCSNSFCPDHIHSPLHSCLPPSLPSHLHHHKLPRCTFQSCNNLSLDAYNPTTPLLCSKCNNSFCAEHRHPTTHNCTPVPSTSDATASAKNLKARALLAKISSSSTSKTSSFKKATKLPTDPTKLAAARKVETMKMRHKAVPLDPKDKSASPPLDQRLHIEVQHGDRAKVFWLRKTLVAGKALDLICDQFGIRQSDSMSIQLSKVKSDAQLRNDTPLSEQVEDGSTLSVTQHTK